MHRKAKKQKLEHPAPKKEQLEDDDQDLDLDQADDQQPTSDNEDNFFSQQQREEAIQALLPTTHDVHLNLNSTTQDGQDLVFRNKQRVLVISTRGITSRHRHLMEDLRTILPHSKKDAKLDSKEQLAVIPDMCETRSCNNCIFFESRRREDLFMWVAKAPDGPSVKMHVQNVSTMDELKLTGNCLRGSRPLLSFDRKFESSAHLVLIKELFQQAFGTPRGHPKSKPFIDHVFSFSFLDGRIWFRNFQIVEEGYVKTPDLKLVEVGPRFVLNPIRIFSGCFTGETLFFNSSFIGPNLIRAAYRKKEERFEQRRANKESLHRRRSKPTKHKPDFSEVFEGDHKI